MRLYKRKDRGNQWCIDYINPITGKRIREIVGTNKKEAEDTLAKIRTEWRKYKDYGNKEYFEDISKQTKQIKFSEMVRIYLDYAKDNKKSVVRDRVSLSHWNNYLVPPQRKVKCSDLYLSEITVKIVEDYKADRLRQIKPVTINWKEKKYIKSSTVNRELACLKHLFNKAIEWEYTKDNPVKRVKLFKENNARIRYLEKEEMSELLKACDSLSTAKYLKAIIIVALNIGLRKSEIFNLKWKNLDFTNDLIYIETSKNGEGAYLPINTEAREVLKNLSPIYELKGGKTVLSEYVFRGRNNKQIKDVRTAFDNVLKESNIKDFRFHDLRHTFASHLVMNGVDLVTVKELMRHKDIRMTLRYAHLSPKHKKGAVESLCRKKNGTRMAPEVFNHNLQDS